MSEQTNRPNQGGGGKAGSQRGGLAGRFDDASGGVGAPDLFGSREWDTFKGAMVSNTCEVKKIIHLVMQRSKGRLDASESVAESSLIVGKAIKTISVLDKDVVEAFCRVLELIDSLVERQDVIEERWWKSSRGRCLTRLNMLGKVKGDKLFFFWSHILNGFPGSCRGLKELNVLQG